MAAHGPPGEVSSSLPPSPSWAPTPRARPPHSRAALGLVPGSEEVLSFPLSLLHPSHHQRNQLLLS